MMILIVEDDEGLSELIREKVEECGYESANVYSGKEAVEWLSAHKAYIMLLDYTLPDMNAKEFITELQRNGDPLPSFIISTGQGDERIAVDMMKLGARDYIVKDKNFLDLLPDVVRRVDKEIENENKRREAEELIRKNEKRIQSLLDEKELILKEVHHRIKNNMNTIKSLLFLQAETLKDPSAVAALQDAEGRVESMMLLYDKLYCSPDVRELSVKDYLPGLVHEIIGNFPNNGIVKIENKIEDFILSAEKLFPLGIIVNELLTNIMKYAFNGRESGVISISASINDSHAVIVIWDNGVGISESISFENSKGFGLELIRMLVEQLHGRIRIERGDGTRFVLEFDVV